MARCAEGSDGSDPKAAPNKESRREHFLTGEELERLGSAIREAETEFE